MGKFDDQVLINTVLSTCDITWSGYTGKDSYSHGHCRDFDLQVSLLPTSVVCRKCAKRQGFYVWHQMGSRGQEDKRNAAIDGGMWFLKQNLSESELKGTEWLRFLHSDDRENTNCSRGTIICACVRFLACVWAWLR